MKAKGNQKLLEGARTASLRKSSLLNEGAGGGGGVFGCKNVPLPRFYILNAGVARPGELTCHIFFSRGTLTMSPPSSGISILPNLNLLRSELGVDYLFYYYSFPF